MFLSRLAKPYTPAGLRSILRRHSDQTVTPYQLRHTFAQNARETLQENDLAVLLGHSDPATTRI